MSHLCEALERRSLLSADLPNEWFGQASDTYTLQVDGVAGGEPLELLSVQWGVTVPTSGMSKAVAEPLYVTLASGAHSPELFHLATTAQSLEALTVTSFTDAGAPRMIWNLTGPVEGGPKDAKASRVVGYQQFLGGDGVLYDQVTFKIEIVDLRFVRGRTTTRFQWNFITDTGDAALPLVDTHYMSTDSAVPATMEVARGQQPVLDYHFAIQSSVGDPVSSGLHYTAVHSDETIALLAGALRGQSVKELTYLQRDELGRPLIHQRFVDAKASQYAFADTVLDDVPPADSWIYEFSRIQSVGYSYRSDDTMNPPVSSGWDLATSGDWNPPVVAAWIAPPTSGVRNAPLPDPVIRFTQPVTGLSVSDFRFEGLTATGLSLTTTDGGYTYTLNGVAARQTQDGHYGIKLFAHGAGVSSGGAPLFGSAGIHWTLDTSAPALTAAGFEYLTSQSLGLVFSEDVSGSLSVTDVQLRNLTNNTTIPAGAMALVYDDQTHRATLTFPGLANGILPDGNYRATLPAHGVTDAAGNPLAKDLSLDFFVLAGDANRDRKVDFADFLILRGNFGRTDSPLFSEADFNYDDKVDFADFLILRSQFGVNLPALASRSLFAGRDGGGGGATKDAVLPR